MRYNINIKNYLPHRAPMLMADEILEIDEKSAITSFYIKEDNIFCENGTFSESGMIENCAQTCSTITGQNLFEDKTSRPAVIGFISNIKKIKIHSLPHCNTEITTKAVLVSEFGNICNITCTTFSGEKLLLEAEIVMFVKKITDEKG